MLPALFTMAAALAAPSPPVVNVLFRVTPEGSELVEARQLAAGRSSGRAAPRLGPHPIDVQLVDAHGGVLATAQAPDPRHRSLVTPEGDHLHATLVRGAGRVVVPWQPDAIAVVIDGQRHPLPEVSPAPESARALPARPPPAAVPIVSSGSDDERLDLVFLGDGYTAEELDDFADDVERMVDYLLGIEPYGDYASLFNVWRVDVASAESGVSSETGTVVERDTAYSCAYGCAGLDRLVCCDDVTVLQTVGTALPGAEGVMVLVNDDKYGGSGGFTYATSYVGEDFGTQVAAHELGHTLVGLWDEYGYGIDGDGDGPNCSSDSEGAWDEWVGTDGVDAFPECSYNSLHRPTLEGCMMRTLQDGYCPVCRQEAVLAMYERLPSLILEVSPDDGVVGSDPPAFEAVVVSDEVLRVEWLLDGELIATGSTFAPDCFAQSGVLTVRAVDDTPWVREDPDGRLEETAGAWVVTAGECDDPATTASPMLEDTGGSDTVACACQSTTGPAGGIAAFPSLLIWWLRRRR